jgi:hypothetical protein
LLRGREGEAARLAGARDASPFAHQAPAPNKVRLHVEPVKPVHVPGVVDAVQDDGVHADNLEIVL